MQIAPCARAAKRSQSSILSTPRPDPNAAPNEASPDESKVAEAYQGDDPTPESVTAIRREGIDAWPRFLDDFSPFMLSCIRRYAADQDERMEIYVHVCTRLAADNCNCPWGPVYWASYSWVLVFGIQDMTLLILNPTISCMG